MTTQVTITLPDEVYRDAERLAQQTGRDVTEVIASTLEISLAPLRQPSQPVEAMSDEEVLLLSESWMDETQNARMSMLLEKQQSGEMDEGEQHELSLLLYVYQEGSLRKARALAEAVRRGLRPPLKS
jgi:hypothetical protein